MYRKAHYRKVGWRLTIFNSFDISFPQIIMFTFMTSTIQKF